MFTRKKHTHKNDDQHQDDAGVVATANTTDRPDKKSKDDEKKGFLPWRYTKELYNDTRFWKQMTLMKGGAGIIATTALLIPTLLTLPIALAGAGVIVAGLLTVAAAFSVVYGTKGLINTFSKAKKRINGEFVENKKDLTKGKKKDEEMSLSQTRSAFKDKIKNKWPVRPIIQSKLVKKLNKSKTWNRFKGFMNESDNVLDTLTVKNSALSIAIFGSMLLTVELVAAPFFLAAAVVVYTIASVGFGMYMAYEGLRDISKRKSELRKQKKLEAERKRKANTTSAKIVRNLKNKQKQASKGLGSIKWKFWEKAQKPEDAENAQTATATAEAAQADATEAKAEKKEKVSLRERFRSFSLWPASKKKEAEQPAANENNVTEDTPVATPAQQKKTFGKKS